MHKWNVAVNMEHFKKCNLNTGTGYILDRAPLRFLPILGLNIQKKFEQKMDAYLKFSTFYNSISNFTQI